MRALFLMPLALSACVETSTATAEGGAAAWLSSGLPFTTTTIDVGTWIAPTGEIATVDPLTLWGAESFLSGMPESQARVVGFRLDDRGPVTAVMALVWSNDPVVCGDDLATIAVDTGLAGFMTPANVAALRKYGAGYDENLYDGSYAEQIDASYPGPFLADIPGAVFPITSSGYGDGGYPVVSLRNAKGEIVALYAQFITGDDDWLLPPPCNQNIS